MVFIQPGWHEWEYVWGPGYIDELAFVVNANVDVRYALQDANYNLVAWLKPASAILSQYTYGPYGDIRAADVRPNHSLPPMGVGHQGLFFVRLTLPIPPQQSPQHCDNPQFVILNSSLLILNLPLDSHFSRAYKY